MVYASYKALRMSQRTVRRILLRTPPLLFGLAELRIGGGTYHSSGLTAGANSGII